MPRARRIRLTGIIARISGPHRHQVFAAGANMGGVITWLLCSQSSQGNIGAGVQGHLLLHNNAIHFAGGSRAAVAFYAVSDGSFRKTGRGRGKDLYVFNKQVYASGFPLYWPVEDSHYIHLVRLPLSDGFIEVQVGKLVAAKPKLNAKGKAQPIWAAAPFREIASVIVTADVVLVTGASPPNRRGQRITEAGLCAVSLADGKILWRQTLPAAPVGWGIALDRHGRILVSMIDGSVACFEPKAELEPKR